MVFLVVIYGCESWTICWAPKNWCFWIVTLEKTLESPLDCEEIKQVNPKGNQSWIFIERTDAEAPILWPPDAKSLLIKKDPDAWERLKAGREGADRGWDSWMASSTQWTSVWEHSGRYWRTGKPGVLQSMGSQRVGRNLMTEQQHPIPQGFPSGLSDEESAFQWRRPRRPRFDPTPQWIVLRKEWVEELYIIQTKWRTWFQQIVLHNFKNCTDSRLSLLTKGGEKIERRNIRL